MQVQKLRAAFISPCIGVGGGDLEMLLIMQNTHNIDWVGLAVADHADLSQVEYTRQFIPNMPIYQKDWGRSRTPGVEYDTNFTNCIYKATQDADIIVTWCVEHNYESFKAINKPIVELSQNSDTYAESVLKNNEEFVDYTVAVSSAAAGIYPDTQNTVLIPNGIDITRCAPRWGREQIRKFWNVEDEERVILFLGRFVEEKNPEAVIQALSKLPDSWKGLFIGEGYGEEPLKKEVQRHLPEDKVKFLGPQRHIGDYLAGADVFLLNSDFEGLPLAVLEAWYAGIPTIVSEIGPLLELKEQFGPTATYVPVRADSETLASACLRAVSHAEDVTEEMSRAHHLVWENYNIARIALLWEENLYSFLHDWNMKKNRPTLFANTAPTPLKSAAATIRTIEHGN